MEKVVTNETNVTTGEPNLPYYDTGSQRLYEAYQCPRGVAGRRQPVVRPELFSSLAHGYGLFRTPRRTSPVWYGRTTTTTAVQDAGENVRIPNVPVSLKRYWFGTDATGTGWHLTRRSARQYRVGRQGHWIRTT